MADTKNKKAHTIYLVGEAKELLMGLAKAEGWNPGPKLVRILSNFSLCPNPDKKFLGSIQLRFAGTDAKYQRTFLVSASGK